MTGDYTRNTFRREQRFTGVREQQGRVHMDADWNEHVDIGHHVTRTTNGDVIGPTGMPQAAAGFAITAAPAAPGSDLLIGEGRAYIGGILVEHEALATTLTKVSGNGIDTIWEVSLGARLALGQWLGPQLDPLSDLAQVSSIEPAQQGDNGRQRIKLSVAYAGNDAEVRGLASLLHQPQLPGATLPAADGFYLAYLDVWEREITVLEDPAIADVALGGPDTALRTQLVWQTKLLPLAALIADGTLGDPPMCKSFAAGWQPDTRTPITLKARATASAAATNPCELPSEGGYRSLENQLYRVELHRGGELGTDALLVKWSRDNAIHRTRLLDVVDGSLVVEETGKDEVTALATDDWVEVRDEGRILRGEPGFFVEIGEVVGTRLGIRTILDPITQAELTQNNEPDAAVLPTSGLVRRWSGGAPVELAPAQTLSLENGIEISFGASTGHAQLGDHWLIPARSLTASIEWPADPASGDPAARPPLGIAHAFCPLAIVEKTAPGWTVTDDCRPIFPPLTLLETFSYLGGDGQEAMPDLTASGDAAFAMIASPLRVGVARGRVPVAGRPVRFRIVDTVNPGRLALLPTTPASDVLFDTPLEIVLRTDTDGIAAVALSIHKDRHQNLVVAELLNASDAPQVEVVHLPIHFTANTSIAAQVAYDPSECAYQDEAKLPPGRSKTVQSAIDKLCPRLELLPLGGDGQTLCVGKPGPWPLTVGVFWGKDPLKGIAVAFKVIAGDAEIASLPITTDANGLASAQLIAGDKPLLNNGIVLVEATLLNGPIASKPSKLVFAARFLNAECIYVGPKVCPPGQAATKSNALADLINYLCQQVGQQASPALHVTGVFRARTASGGAIDRPLLAYAAVPPAILARGIVFELDGPVDPAALERGAVGHISLELPFAAGKDEVITWWNRAPDNDLDPHFAWQRIRLEGALTIAEGNERSKHGLLWTPSAQAAKWLESAMAAAFKALKLPLRAPAEAVLHGQRIYSDEEPVRHLDGALLLDAKERTGARYPAGDGRTGGDFCLPFFVAPSR
jgi:hypothetical protein